ncbi:MAG: hypothetical protein AAF619_00920 [Pseudomonadota bacterium]
MGRLIVSGLRNELKMACHGLRSTPGIRFLIFAQGRTGSTLLTSTLDTHPEITCHDEILGVPRAFPMAYVENTARAHGVKCFGFHVKIYQLTTWQRITNVSIWLEKMSTRGWKILYLRRQNILKQIVSNAFAEAAGIYHHRQGQNTKRPNQIDIPVDKLYRSISWRLTQLDAERKALNGLDYLELLYDRDLETPDSQRQTFERIQSFLDVDVINLKARLQKAVNRPMSQLISNYDEVHSALLGTEYEIFLN